MNFGFRLYFDNKTEYVPRSALTGVTEGNVTVYRGKVDHVSVEWRFEQIEKGTVVTLTAESDRLLGINRIDSLVFDINGYARTDRIPFFGTTADHTETRYPSELVENKPYSNNATGLFPNLAARGMAMACLAPFDIVTGAGVVRSGNTLTYIAKNYFTVGMQSQNKVTCERVFFSEDITIDELYDVYRSYIPTSSFSMPKLTGWNSWDYYMQDVRPEDIFANVDYLKNSPLKEHLQYIIIDDGWQKNWGDWWENEKFACGLKHVADKIKEAGFTPGIWMAPLRIHKTAEMLKGHMHWFSKDDSYEDGVMCFGEMYCIDPTVPEARQYILDTYKKLYDYGFRVFKIDFLDHVIIAKEFYDPEATAFSALRDLMADIMKVTGEDTIILGCSLPVQCGADIAPSMRIGVDIHIHFHHVAWAAETLAWTWMYNNRVTRIDPDFLVVRGDETSSYKWERHDKYLLPSRRGTPEGDDTNPRWANGDRFNAIEAETWANLVAISGGNMILSDNMPELNERGISIIENAFRIAGQDCRPMYLPDDIRQPSVWKGENAILIINWEDVPRAKTVPNLCDNPTSDKPLTANGRDVTVSLLPHESIVIFPGQN